MLLFQGRNSLRCCNRGGTLWSVVDPRICFKRPATSFQPPRRKGPGYPARLLIYHAGIGRTVFLGCTKITTLFLFAFSALVIAPRFYYAPDEPNWTAAAAIMGGAVPLLFVGFTTAPFVSYVHVSLPIFARQSRDHLMRWSKNIAPNTEVELTTMRLYGLPRVSRMQLSNLHVKERGLFGVANLARSPGVVLDGKKRPWWMGKEATRFYVGEDQRRGKEPALWPSVLEAIRENEKVSIGKTR